MDNALYTTLNRQSGLVREMQAVANNIANMSTNGYRKEGVIFTEHLAALEGDESFLSMASAEGRSINLSQGVLQQTGGPFDFAIEGEGFFLVATPQGNQLTRAGAFVRSPEGILTTPEGYALLDTGEGPVTIAADAGPVTLGQDGTLSAGGEPVAQIGLFLPSDPAELSYVSGTRFSTTSGVVGTGTGQIFQGFLENSNTDAVAEITRMISVQRAYELGQKFLDAEDGRVRAVIQTLGR